MPRKVGPLLVLPRLGYKDLGDGLRGQSETFHKCNAWDYTMEGKKDKMGALYNFEQYTMLFLICVVRWTCSCTRQKSAVVDCVLNAQHPSEPGTLRDCIYT